MTTTQADLDAHAAAIAAAIRGAFCWEQPADERLIACDRRKDHHGGHSWELPTTDPAGLPDGEWLEIAFMGHIEYRGAYVRQVTRNGQAAYRAELPDYVFGGDPAAVRHHAASAWFGDQPVSEATVRAAWERKQAAAEEQRRREAEWERQQAERALPAGDSEDDPEAEPF